MQFLTWSSNFHLSALFDPKLTPMHASQLSQSSTFLYQIQHECFILSELHA